MEPRSTQREGSDFRTSAPASEADPSTREKVFRFLPRLDADVSAPERRRDWGTAINLVREAAEAVRFAEERAQNAEDYSKRLEALHKEQLRDAEARIAAADQRADIAAQRVAEAEGWLAKFYDAITEHFGEGRRPR